jgi:hypothetical protein
MNGPNKLVADRICETHHVRVAEDPVLRVCRILHLDEAVSPGGAGSYPENSNHQGHPEILQE